MTRRTARSKAPRIPPAATRSFARSSLWRVAQTVLRYPEPSWEDDLADPDLWSAASRAAEILADPILAEALATTSDSFLRTDRANLEACYVATFGHTVRGGAPPYELEWGANEGLLAPHHLADLGAFYRAHGLAPARGAERSDHVATECEFVHFLAFKEGCAEAAGHADHAAACREAASLFLAAHLGRCVPAFVAALRREAGDGPYGAAAAFLAALSEHDAREFGVRLGDAALPLRSVSTEDEIACISCSAKLAAPPE